MAGAGRSRTRSAVPGGTVASVFKGAFYSPSKVSLSVGIIFCIAFFLLGYLCGGRVLHHADTVKPVGVRAAGGKLQQQKEGDVAVGGLLHGGEQQRRLLATAVEHGQTGEGTVESIPYKILSWEPRALLFPGFAPRDVCEKIVMQAKEALTPSGLALRSGETAETMKDVRTSSGTFMVSSMEPTGSLEWVERKMHKVIFLPISHGEAFNILRYEVGQKYNAHYDTFDPAEFGPQDSMRLASFLLYLSDVEEGGETMFPFAGGRNMGSGYDFVQCLGLRVKPRMGDALLFYSLLPNGTIDKTSMHGSCPVIRGEKWVATRWIRDKPSGIFM